MIGSQIGRYTITEEIGRGGMGIVYRAVQTTLNRTVAVKMLSQSLVHSEEHLARFRREAETLARLDHENIVRIYDIEELEDTHCIIMEYIGGPSLSRVLAREGRLAPRRARDIAGDVASALSAAHRQGIIHRDIKPDNILFTTEGRLKLTDFGIARMADPKGASAIIGTPSYMSPEQAGARSVTPASDIYSLGVVLFEMLAGRVPFEGTTPVAVALKHMSEPPPRLDELVAGMPAELCAVTARTLAKQPADRFESAKELREALLGLDLPEVEVALEAAVSGILCPECGFKLREDFLTCPRCALPIRQRCATCGRLYDPLSPECPFCRTLATSGQSQRISGPQTGPPLAAVSDELAAARRVPAAAPTVVQPGPEPAPADQDRARPREPDATQVVPSSEVPLRERRAVVTPAGATRGRRPSPRVIAASAAGVCGLAVLVAFFALRRPDPPTVPLAGPASAPAVQPRLADNRMPAAAPASTPAPAVIPLPDSVSAPRPQPVTRTDPAPKARTQPAPGSPRTASAPQPKQPEPSPDSAIRPAPSAEPAWGPEAQAAARTEILAIIERQRRATVEGNLDLLLEDVGAELHETLRADFRRMRESAREFTSEVSRQEIVFTSPLVAQARFRDKLAGRRLSDGRSVRIFDGEITWKLERRGGRWLITGL